MSHAVHRAHGLRFHRFGRSRPLIEEGGGSGIDVAVTVGLVPPWEGSPFTAELLTRVAYLNGELARSLERVSSGVHSWWVQRTRMDLAIAFHPSGNSAHVFGGLTVYPRYVESTIFGPVASFARWLRGWPSLHASSVLVDGKVLAVAGNSGSGKSTTTAMLALGGYPLLTDDLLGWEMREGQVAISPGVVPLKLFPAALDALSLDPGNFCPILPNLQKRFVPVPGVDSDRDYPLGAIYVLEPCDRIGPGEIRATEGTEAFLLLKAHCRDDSILPSHLRPVQFQSLAELARRVPIRRVGAHSGLDRLSSFAEALLQDFRLVAR